MRNDDRKMFAPLRSREAISPEAKVCAIVARSDSGTIAADLAEHLVRSGFAVGTRTLVTRRIEEMLESLEQEGRMERVPDGRYRVVPTRSTGR